jgi:DnaJ-domain-containing protein 1
MTEESARSNVDQLRALIQEHRTALETLESALAAQFSAAPIQVPARRAARIARNEVRRAARRAARQPADSIFVALPPLREVTNRDRYRELEELAGARKGVWQVTNEVIAALRSGDYPAARDGLTAILNAETALQAVAADLQVPELWHDVADELADGSDAVIEGARAALAALDRTPPDETRAREEASRMLTGQSHWSRAWHAFVQVVPVTSK